MSVAMISAMVVPGSSIGVRQVDRLRLLAQPLGQRLERRARLGVRLSQTGSCTKAKRGGSGGSSPTCSRKAGAAIGRVSLSCGSWPASASRISPASASVRAETPSMVKRAGRGYSAPWREIVPWVGLTP